ncbi:MAG: excalibur calcium-binding domain-containing protein [Pseudomonadota bacterium]
MFIAQLLIGMSIAGIATWQFTPRLLAASPFADAAPDERSDTERIEQSVYYPRCAVARAVGAAPIHRGSPGYREELDADGDGVACEPLTPAMITSPVRRWPRG